MRQIVFFLLSLWTLIAQGTPLYPGQTIDISHEPTMGEHGPTWSVDNPTLHLSSVGFLCHVTPQAYFSGTATVTCTYQDRIGLSEYTRTRRWTFTCVDTRISITPTTKSVKINDTFQINWSFDKIIHITPQIQFTGYDASVISVDSNGLVTAKSKGKTSVYVKSSIGTNSAICTVSVSETNIDNQFNSNSPYDNWDSNNSQIIRLKAPGTLSDYIQEHQKYSIEDLTIIGPLDGSDLRLLREMVGVDCDGKTTNGKLTSIDLKEAVFVSGGPWYVKAWQNYEYTEDSPYMPFYSFAWLRKLKRIRFPQYCYSLTSGSLLQCQSLEQISIPCGTTTLDRYSLNGGYENMPLCTLTLPASFSKFDADVYMCKNLTDIYCYATTPPDIQHLESFISQTNIRNGTLYVPKGCANAYWRTNGWRSFKNIKEILEKSSTLYVETSENGVIDFNGITLRKITSASYSGRRAFEMPSDKKISIKVIPDDGYAVSNVYLNNLPVPYNEANQSIELEGIDNSCLKIEFTESASIGYIDSNDNERYDVYNLAGICIRKGLLRDRISGIDPGVYILKGQNSVEKIVVK